MRTLEIPNELTTKSVVPFFLDFAQTLSGRNVATDTVFRYFIRFYRECRVVGAPVEDGYNSDTFCVEAGCFPKVIANEFADYRGTGDIAFTVCSDEMQLSIRRTLHPVNALQGLSEFDDDGFELAITLYFGPSDDTETFSMEASTLEGLDEGLGNLPENPLIARLLTERPSSIGAHVGGVG